MRRFPKGSKCIYQDFDILKHFKATETSNTNHTAARKQAMHSLRDCEYYCGSHPHCRACSVNCTRTCGWMATRSCDMQQWQGLIIGDVSLKGDSLAYIRKSVCVTHPGCSTDVWQIINATAGCFKNKEAIVPITNTFTLNLETCQRVCESNPACAAIDFVQKTNVCLMFDQACSSPLSVQLGVVSFTLLGRDSRWRGMSRGRPLSVRSQLFQDGT